jgi:hypothetical protein
MVENKTKVILLLSDKRSGSTFFQEMFNLRSEISTVKYTPHSNGETHFWTMAAVLLDDRLMKKQVFLNQYNGYGSVRSTRILMHRLLERNGVLIDREITQLEDIFYYWEKLIESSGNQFFFEKSPQLLSSFSATLLLVKWLNCTMKDVFVIGLIRNPYAVLNSAYQLFHTNPEKRQFGWLDIYRNLYFIKGIFPNDYVLIVKYEDLVSTPDVIFKTLSDKLGITEWDRKSFSSIKQDSIDTWKTSSLLNNGLNQYVEILSNIVGYLNSKPRVSNNNFHYAHKPFLEKINRLSRFLFSKIYYRYLKWLRYHIDDFKNKNSKSGHSNHLQE